jgi:hypothetical protein
LPAFQGTRRRDYKTLYQDTLDRRLIKPTMRGRARSRGFQLRDELLGRDQTEGLFDDRRDLTPVDLVVAGEIQEHSHPVRERAAGRRRRTEEACRFGAHQLLLHAPSSRAPQRRAAITAMVVVDVPQRPRSPDEEARRAVTPTLRHLWQRERDAPNHLDLTLSHTDTSGADRAAPLPEALTSDSA